MDSQKSALAHFIQDVGKTTAWWYGINIKGSDPNSLAMLLGLSQEQLMGLLRVIGWVKKLRGAMSTPNIQTEAIKIFIQQYGLSNIVETTRIVYKSKSNCCFIRIGCFSCTARPTPVSKIVMNWEKPVVDCLINKQLSLHGKIGVSVSLPCRAIAALGRKESQSGPGSLQFHRSSHPGNKLLVDISTKTLSQSNTQRNLLSSGAMEDECTTPMDSEHKFDSPSINNSGETTNNNNIAENKMIMAIIESQLLPKIFKSEHRQKNYWLNPDTFDEDTANTIINLAAMLTKMREKRMCELMGASFMSPKEKVNLPTFQKYSIDPTNKRLIRALVRDLVTLSLNSPNHDLLHTQMENGKLVLLVRILKSVNETSMQRNDADNKWVKQLLTALGPQKQEQPSNTMAGSMYGSVAHKIENSAKRNSSTTGPEKT